METRVLGTRDSGADNKEYSFTSVSFTMMRKDQARLEKTRTIPSRDLREE